MSKLTPRVFWDVYFDLNGRIGRGEFWAYGVALNVAMSVALFALAPVPSPWGLVVSALVCLVAFWGYAGLMVKRGHDRGRPAVLSISLVVLRLIVFVMTSIQGYLPALVILQVGLIVYVLVDYALMPGMKAANRYGPPPGGADFNRTPLILGGEPAQVDAALSTPKSNA